MYTRTQTHPKIMGITLSTDPHIMLLAPLE